MKLVVASVAVVIAVLLLVSFAIPVSTRRTGELSAPPLPIVENGPVVQMPERVWVDTDAACGHRRITDPDDCFALTLLAQASDIEIVGISTVFCNAPWTLPIARRGIWCPRSEPWALNSRPSTAVPRGRVWVSLAGHRRLMLRFGTGMGEHRRSAPERLVP
ncbi:hypothetical protein L861_16870 [Litchfieldella anticariensis FP35 = DSM 16096]|uniref:Inosine/uridine-preferring nucleoside hydrolase domain-containing protein n=1 Tax=Litchfieldella anticariensis (strain DSM 16096 / CECT 5854 / CIP 108499 / LMG 22089 / FP35) TaxID=1121939 RepID=S2L1L1_LITA3|nr:hypothetical protein [Halomonas anticariensis]EPC01544.1 hypothetical protein L861_16870 [Halomonas anticariensis FP35 = DSM 16096]